MPATTRAAEMFEELRELGQTDPAALTKHVEDWKANHRMEDEYLDFKTSAHSYNDPKVKDKDAKDAETWSKTVASFANTSGGLVVWGIYAGPEKGPDGRMIDTATDLRPLANTTSFVQFLKNKLRDSTNEPILGIEHLVIAASAGVGGYVISLVPEGQNKPYRAMRLPGQPYLFRIGDGTEIIPHGILKSLFFPRLQPKLRLRARVFTGNPNTLMFFVTVQNVGSIASATEMVMRVTSNKNLNSISGDAGFKSQQFTGAKQEVRAARVWASQPLHPGDESDAFTVLLPATEQRQIAGFQLDVAIFMANQEPCGFRHRFTLDEMSYDDTYEMEQVGFASPSP